MTPEQKDEALRLVIDIIHQWADEELHSEAAMFALRDGMAALSVPKHFGRSKGDA